MMFKDKDWFKKINLVFVSIGIYVLILFIFIANSSAFYSFNYRIEPKIVREGLLLPQVDEVETLFNVDPLLSTSRNEVVIEIRKKISSLLFSSLFKENTDGTLRGDLVTDYNFKDSTELNISIRNDVYWSDGKQLTAEDIEFTLSAIRSLGQESVYVGASNANEIQVSIISPTQIKILLQNQNGPRPNASYPYELTFPILPKHILSEYSKPDLNILHLTEFGKKPVSSGPFVYDFNRIDEVILARNPKYYKQYPQFDSYIFRFYKNYSDLINAFKLRNIDIFMRDENLRDGIHEQFTSEDLDFKESIIRNRKIALYFNLASKTETASIFNNLVIPRRALLQSIARSKIFQGLNGVKVREIYGPIDHSSWAFSNEVLERNQYEPKELETALQKLDYDKKDGFYTKAGKKLSMKISYLKGDFNDLLLDLLSKQLEGLGIEIILNGLEPSSLTGTLDQNSFGAIVNNRDYDVLLTYVDKNLDPNVFAEWHSSTINAPGLNFSAFSSRVADRTLADARVLSKQEDRKTQYIRFQKVFYDESAPAIFLFNPSKIVYTRKNLNINLSDSINSPSSVYDNIHTWNIK